MNRVLILGATSTIAAEVAVLHAQRGDKLLLVGRNPDKLREVVSRTGGEAASFTADLDNLPANEAVIERAIATLGGLDTVFMAHGLLGDQLATEATFGEAEKTFRTNFLSAVSLLIPVANWMEQARAGRIGVITSVAGERGRPRNYTYGAAKGALTLYLQGVRSRLYPSGVHVTNIKLGPIDTPMTVGHNKHFLFGKPKTVAKDIVHAMDAGTPEAYVPSFWGAIMPVVKNMPEGLFQRLPFLSGR